MQAGAENRDEVVAMIKDNTGVEIKIGDIGFYSERPHSNYADGLIEVYRCEDSDRVLVGTLIVNGFGGNEYQVCGRRYDDLELENYTWDTFHRPTDSCENICIIPGLRAEEATIEYANKHYPLSR